MTGSATPRSSRMSPRRMPRSRTRCDAPAGRRTRWQARGTTPARVADVLGALAPALRPPDPLVHLLDALAAHAYDEEQARSVAAVRRAVCSGDALPDPRPARQSSVSLVASIAEAW